MKTAWRVTVEIIKLDEHSEQPIGRVGMSYKQTELDMPDGPNQEDCDVCREVCAPAADALLRQAERAVAEGRAKPIHIFI